MSFPVINNPWVFGGFGFPYSDVVQPAPDAQVRTLETVTPAKPLKRQGEPMGLNSFQTYASVAQPCGFDPIPPLSVPIMWRMRAYPAIALVSQVLVFSPLLTSTRSIEVLDDMGQQARAAEIKANAEKDLLPVLAKALPGACECLHFGHWLQEIIWERRDGRTVPTEARPVLPLEAVINEDSGRKFSGYKINDQPRDARYGFLAVNQPHIDPVRGYSRNQNALVDWWRAIKSEANADRTERKASGIQMMLGVPQGQSFYTTDAAGNQTPILPKDMVQSIADNASQGNTFVVPLTPFSKDDIEGNPALADIEAVRVKEFDWGGIGESLNAHLARLDRLDRNMIRAWYHGEREATEGQHGTLAEAQAHKAGGVFDCELVHAAICEQWDEQMFRYWLLTNYGPEWVGKLRTKASPLSDPVQEFLQEAVKVMLTDPATSADMEIEIDTRALLERTKMPLLAKEAVEKERQAQADEAAKQNQNQQQAGAVDGNAKVNGQPPVNGNGNPMKQLRKFVRQRIR